MSDNVQKQSAECNPYASSSLSTALQVLDDNIWEQRAQSQQQASSSRLDLPADMETDAVLPVPRSQQSQQTPEAAVHPQQLPSAPAEFISGNATEVPRERRAVAPAEQSSKRARINPPAQRPPRWGRGCERVLWSSASGRSAVASKRPGVAAAWRGFVCVLFLPQSTVSPTTSCGDGQLGQAEAIAHACLLHPCCCGVESKTQ